LKAKFGQIKDHDEHGFFLYRRVQGKNLYCRIRMKGAVNYMTISWYVQNRWNALQLEIWQS